jgi:hypothetical protein
MQHWCMFCIALRYAVLLTAFMHCIAHQLLHSSRPSMLYFDSQCQAAT